MATHKRERCDPSSPFYEYKYTRDTPAQMVHWFEEEYRKVSMVEVSAQSGLSRNFARRPPTFQRCCIECLKVSYNTLKRWCDRYGEMQDAWNYCKQIQEAIIVENASTGTYDASFAKFMLVNHHGYSDKHTIENEGPVVIGNVIINRIVAPTSPALPEKSANEVEFKEVLPTFSEKIAENIEGEIE